MAYVEHSILIKEVAERGLKRHIHTSSNALYHRNKTHVAFEPSSLVANALTVFTTALLKTE